LALFHASDDDNTLSDVDLLTISPKLSKVILLLFLLLKRSKSFTPKAFPRISQVKLMATKNRFDIFGRLDEADANIRSLDSKIDKLEKKIDTKFENMTRMFVLSQIPVWGMLILMVFK